MSFNGKLVIASETEVLLEKFKLKFVDCEKLIAKKLMWNSFKLKPTRMIYEAGKARIPSNQELYFYLERSKQLYVTNDTEIIEFIDNLEPWEDIDAYVFDKSFGWVLSITHEDLKILTVGL